MNLQDVLVQHGVSVAAAGHHHVRSGWIGVDCPHCSPGWEKFRLGFELGTGRCNCWFCGRVDPVQTLALLLRSDFKTALSIWGSRDRYLPKVERHSGVLKMPAAGDLLPAHKSYLQRRGFDPLEIQRVWNVLGIGPTHPTLRWRLLIPIFDRYGKAVSWTTRSLNPDAHLRYISAPPEQESIPHKSILYGAHLARHSVIICEGPLDAWAIGPGAVATCGIGFSSQQMAEMSEYPVRVVCFDSDDDAQRRAEKLCKHLSAFPGITEQITLETGKDPAEAEKSEIQELRRKFLQVI